MQEILGRKAHHEYTPMVDVYAFGIGEHFPTPEYFVVET